MRSGTVEKSPSKKSLQDLSRCHNQDLKWRGEEGRALLHSSLPLCPRSGRRWAVSLKKINSMSERVSQATAAGEERSPQPLPCPARLPRLASATTASPPSPPNQHKMAAARPNQRAALARAPVPALRVPWTVPLGTVTPSSPHPASGVVPPCCYK